MAYKLTLTVPDPNVMTSRPQSSKWWTVWPMGSQTNGLTLVLTFHSIILGGFQYADFHPPLLTCLLVTSWWRHWRQKINSISCKSTILLSFPHLQSGWWMKNSPPKIVVARLTAGKLYCFLHGGRESAKREATSTSGGREAAYWNAHMVFSMGAHSTLSEPPTPAAPTPTMCT